jgi:hypothetical protein
MLSYLLFSTQPQNNNTASNEVSKTHAQVFLLQKTNFSFLDN